MSNPPVVNFSSTYFQIASVGIPSYLDLTVNGPPSQWLPTNSPFDGWCADTTHSIPKVATLDAYVYATTGISSSTATMCGIGTPENFDSVNWLLNQNFSKGPTYTLGDVQVAIWKLLGENITQGDLDTVGLYTDAKVQTLYNLALAKNGYVPDITDCNPCNDNVTVLLSPFLTDGTQKQCIVTTVKSAALGNYVWYDCDKDGKQDCGENGVAGVTVKLIGGGDDGKVGGIYGADDIVLKTTTTDCNGYYKFVGLNPGYEYQVQFVAPKGYDFTTPNAGSNDYCDSDANQTTGKTQVVTLDAGEFDKSLDAGLVKECGSWSGGCYGSSDGGWGGGWYDAGWCWG